ncbi:MAG: response regulator transcription factor [Fimbriimonadaceae bacterium]|nr:response regulator transcription factor [Fimbriimonadaceae bacterium]
MVLLVLRERLFAGALASLLRTSGFSEVRLAGPDVAASMRESTGIVIVDLTEAKEPRVVSAIREGRATGRFRVVVLAADASDAQDVGYSADAVCLRTETPERLLAAVGSVSERAPASVAESVGRYRAEKPLTERESDIVRLVRRGYKNREIALEWGIREQTVKNILSKAMRDRGLRNRVDVLRWLEGAQPGRVGP